MARLILFDIDLTLIATLGAGRHAMAAAFRRLYGVEDCTHGISFDGRTDHAIFMEALTLYGKDDGVGGAYRAFCDAYVEELPRSLTEKTCSVLPGVVEALDSIEARGLRPGLATGNQVRGAERKLGHFGLWERFAAGGFGDDTPIRAEVVRAGIINLATAMAIEPDPEDTIVIGDTPLDIEAARLAGAKAMGVATGKYSVEELLSAKADWAVRDLGAPGVIEILLGS